MEPRYPGKLRVLREVAVDDAVTAPILAVVVDDVIDEGHEMLGEFHNKATRRQITPVQPRRIC